MYKFAFRNSRCARSLAPRMPSRVGARAPWNIQTRELQGLAIGIPKETQEGEKRVSLIPADVSKLIAKGATVSVQAGAGVGSGFADEHYAAAGATVVKSAEDIWKQAVVTKVNPPESAEAAKLGNRVVVGQLNARTNVPLVDQLASQQATGIDMTMLLRTLSRGQSFDVLSSQANMAGYRAVVEASHMLQRPFAGQMTAAGRVNPAKVLVIGAGVAGLAAIQQAKNMNAVVTAFDVRAAAAEQCESMGAKFLKVSTGEDGSAAGGYAKEMSAEWFEAAEKVLAKACAESDVIITTALIPGKPAPKLIKKYMVDAMPSGGVTVDLAAPAGGNVETTVSGKVVQHPLPSGGHVTCIGHNNFPSLISSTASLLFSGNVTKLLLSMEDKETNQFIINTETDEAVRSMCVVNSGAKLEPYVPPPPPPKAEEKEVKVEAEPDPAADAMRLAMANTGVAMSAITLGSFVPAGGMAATFALSVWVGSQAVKSVAHSLHSPLMSVTNAISGMTIVGGMLQLGGGMGPSNTPQVLALAAVGLSAVNLVGGFIVTKKMLDMFRRPDDPPEYWHYYLMPPGVAVGAFSLMSLTGSVPAGMPAMMGLLSGLGCIGGISAMSSQSTTRLAPMLAMGGVGTGIATALFAMDVDSGTYFQLIAGSAAGGSVGYALAKKIEPTSLPQAVAGFHSLVGFAATATALGDFMVHDFSHMDGFHRSSIYLGAWMGSITATGSIIACAKLAEKMSSAPLSLPGKDQANMAMGAGSALGLVSFATTKDPSTAAVALTAGTGFSGLLGLHMTASIGGADMPVVITLLNSYSGWALCAEGFILDQPMLAIVGALIGSSGAFLTKIMCDGMNRSLPAVILGGFGVEAGTVATNEGLVHTEIDIAGTVSALKDAQKVVIVPGYGLAVAQAQYEVAAMANLLRDAGVEVQFAVHPVAGRMPGQLNVLLAEAGVPYDMVFEMEEVNEDIHNADVVMVIGANDTVNCAAEDDPKSAIAGMPVIRVWTAKHVVFMKRSMAMGYAGVDNPVFYKENNDMLLGDAKDTCEKLKNGLKGV